MSASVNTLAAQSVRLRKFDMKMIPQDAVCVFIGRRRTGKSTLVKDLLFHHQNIPMGTVISGTEESNSFYGKIIPPIFIHGEYNSAILANFVKRQKLITSKIQQQENSRTAGQPLIKSNLDPRSFMILDDCLYDDSWIRDINIRYLFLNSLCCLKTFLKYCSGAFTSLNSPSTMPNITPMIVILLNTSISQIFIVTP
jgi:hypothetical protein